MPGLCVKTPGHSGKKARMYKNVFCIKNHDWMDILTTEVCETVHKF